MNNKDFIKAVSKEAGYTINDVTNVFKAIESVVTKELSSGEDVKVLNGVTFKQAIKEAHEVRNPRDGSMVKVPTKRTIKAAFTDSFKDKIQ